MTFEVLHCSRSTSFQWLGQRQGPRGSAEVTRRDALLLGRPAAAAGGTGAAPSPPPPPPLDPGGTPARTSWAARTQVRGGA
jgi:hypothetical protein